MASKLAEVILQREKRNLLRTATKSWDMNGNATARTGTFRSHNFYILSFHVTPKLQSIVCVHWLPHQVLRVVHVRVNQEVLWWGKLRLYISANPQWAGPLACRRPKKWLPRLQHVVVLWGRLLQKMQHYQVILPFALQMFSTNPCRLVVLQNTFPPAANPLSHVTHRLLCILANLSFLVLN